MIHEYEINGLLARTGDIICTRDEGPRILGGQFWRYIGHLIPGDVDHVAVYVGPGGRCVEAGARGRVITFSVIGHTWDHLIMREQRGEMADALYGIACPVEGRGLSESEKAKVRENVAGYCLAQAAAEKPYNLDFFKADTEDAFYCSQLAYMAYLMNGIDLNTGLGIPHIPQTSNIIFPQDIWNGCVHAKCSPAGPAELRGPGPFQQQPQNGLPRRTDKPVRQGEGYHAFTREE
jgi:hypothetical protein